jgi:hypothetical protein
MGPLILLTAQSLVKISAGDASPSESVSTLSISDATGEPALFPWWLATEVEMTPWTDDEVRALRDMAGRLGVDPRDLVKLMCHESGCNPAAHNPGGAVGLIQFEPNTLRSMSWHNGQDAFAKLTVGQQLPYVERYFGWFAATIAEAGGGLGTLYTATFLPARIPGSNDPTHVLCSNVGPLSWAYAANRVFDAAHKGSITVGDMIAAAEGAYSRSSVGKSIVAALDALDTLDSPPNAA